MYLIGAVYTNKLCLLTKHHKNNKANVQKIDKT